MKTLDLFCLILRYIMFYFVDKNESGYQDICEEINIVGYGTICYHPESEILTYETSDDTVNKGFVMIQGRESAKELKSILS